MSKAMRKFLALTGIFVIICLWVILITTIGIHIVDRPDFVQLGFYVLAGILWVVPCKPLLEWMKK